MHAEQSFYNPKFFDKHETLDQNGKLGYKYTPKADNLYWRLREAQDWSTIPRIFDNDCEPFY